MLDQLGDPRRISHVGLAAWHILQMLGIEQPHLRDALLKLVEHQLPVHPGGLQTHPGH